jgi:hypothetical protein
MEAIIKANRPNLSSGSLRTYLSILKNLAKSLGVEFESATDVVKHYKKILEKVKDMSPNIRKTRLSACVVFCEKAHGADEALKAFRETMNEDRKEFNKEQDEQKMSERQKEGMIPYAEVLEKYHTLESAVLPLLKKEKWEKKDFTQYQLYVLLSCMLLIEPRRSLDWTEFKLRNIKDGEGNYLKLVKRKPFLVFNCYKTAGKYGQQMIECPPKLHKIIKGWMERNPHEWLLMNTRQDNKISPTQLTNILYAFFEKPISTSMLRHIYLSDKYKDLPALSEMKERASAMGQSLETALTYVKKAPSAEEMKDTATAMAHSVKEDLLYAKKDAPTKKK